MNCCAVLLIPQFLNICAVLLINKFFHLKGATYTYKWEQSDFHLTKPFPSPPAATSLATTKDLERT